MHALKLLLPTVGLFASLIATATGVWAGPVTVVTPVGGKVIIGGVYTKGGSFDFPSMDGSALDEDKNPGSFKYTIKDENDLKLAGIRSVEKVKGFPQLVMLDLGIAGLRSFEPIDIFPFSSTDPDIILLARIDVPSFIVGGSSFSEDQVFSVVNGLLSGTDGIVFRDASSLFTGVGSFFDVFIDLESPALDNLPLYSGDARVGPAMKFRVPEPGSLALVILGIMAVATATRSRRVRSGPGTSRTGYSRS